MPEQPEPAAPRGDRIAKLALAAGFGGLVLLGAWLWSENGLLMALSDFVAYCF
ncbi:MAG TPA: hypothetical protein VEH84_08030 [Alphaproteobacteria bacterium]|nr:hypothetical protein [Alphaproteobacteria bacterium]